MVAKLIFCPVASSIALKVWRGWMGRKGEPFYRVNG